MKLKQIIESLKRATMQIDPVLLVFLLFVLNFRLSFKLIALVGVFAYRPNFKFTRDGLFYFYIGMPLIGLLNFLFVGHDYSVAHGMVVLTGMLFWLAALLVTHQVRLSLANIGQQKFTETLKALTLINFAVSMFDIVRVMWITHTINPYTQVSPPPYGISSGDLIGGVFGGMHLVNTIICSMLAMYFVYRSNLLYVLLALIPFLLTGSNLGTFILGGCLILLAFVSRGIMLKNFAFFCAAFIALFYLKVTPDNQRYMAGVLRKVSNQLMGKKKAEPVTIKTDTLHVPMVAVVKKKRVLSDEELIIQYIAYRKKVLHLDTLEKFVPADTAVMNRMSAMQKRREAMVSRLNDYVFFRKDSVAKSKAKMALFDYGKLKTFDLDKESGKITSFKQTKAYLQSDASKAILGAGIGSFSSRLAFISSGIVEDSRMLKVLPTYETKEFRDNHKAIFKYLMYRDDDTHSITNLPFCWYNQLFGEYGLIGVLLFIVCYVFYWLKQIKRLSYGKYLVLAMFGFFFFDYWFERISVMVIFEMLLFIDIKFNKTIEA